MAQARLNDFFATKKRFHGANPSKRRKIESTESDPKTKVICRSDLDGSAEAEKPSCSTRTTGSDLVASRSSRRTKAARNSQQAAPRPTRTRTYARKTDVVGQITIQNAFAKSSESSSDIDGQDLLCDAGLGEVTEEVTSQWDEHDGPKTPKRSIRSADRLPSPNGETTGTTEIRRKAIARRSRASAWTPNKGEDEKKEQVLRRSALASSFLQKLASASSLTDLESKV